MVRGLVCVYAKCIMILNRELDTTTTFVFTVPLNCSVTLGVYLG